MNNIEAGVYVFRLFYLCEGETCVEYEQVYIKNKEDLSEQLSATRRIYKNKGIDNVEISVKPLVNMIYPTFV